MKRNKNILTIVICLLLAAVLVFILQLHRENSGITVFSGEIKVGFIAPLTGTHAAGGNSMKKGVSLAVDTINAKGGIDGAKLTLAIRDDRNEPKTAETAAKELITQEAVDVIIGPYSSECCLVLKEIVNAYGVPLLVPIAMDDSVITGRDYVFRNTLSVQGAQDKINAYADMEKGQYVLLDGFHAESLGIIWQNDAWGQALQERILEDLESVGRKDALYFSQSFDLGQSDFSHIFVERKKRFPDVIYVIASGEEAVSIVSQGRDCGYQGLFYGEGGFNYGSFDEQLGEKADGCLFTSQWHPSFSTPMSDVFLQLYSEKYHEIPDMFAAICYEAVYILQDSLANIDWKNQSESLRRQLQRELSIPKELEGLSGVIRFDENGQCDRPMFLLQKQWDGMQIQSFIVYPARYSQGNFQWNFDNFPMAGGGIF